MDDFMVSIIERFGAEDLRDFAQTLNRFSEIVEEETGKAAWTSICADWTSIGVDGTSPGADEKPPDKTII